MSEVNISRTVITWLEADGWTVFPEVQLHAYGRRADIVAVRDRVVWIIECKLSLTLALICQAHDWIGYANFVSVAFPSRRQKRNGSLADILEKIGIGAIPVNGDSAFEWIESPFLRRPYDIRPFLCEQHRAMGVAGSQSEFYTPFRNTMRQASEYVRAHPGCTIKEVATAIKHHYRAPATAMACLRKWNIPGGEDKLVALGKGDEK